MTRWGEPAPYPDPRAGERFRMLKMPVESPKRESARPAKNERRSGGTCDVRRTVAGLAPRGERSPDEYVTDWRPV